MFNPKKYTLPKTLATQVELEAKEGKLYAFSTRHQAWIELSDKWRITPEASLELATYYSWDKVMDDETISYPESQWNCFSKSDQEFLVNRGFKKTKHHATTLGMFAYTKQGHPLVNFRYIDHKLYADIIK